jgi:hypothetical protein
MKCVLLIVFLLSLPVTLLAESKLNFNQDVRPILSDRCFHCHGPDEESREKKLRLDIADGKEGAYRVRKGKAAIKPGSLQGSEVWKRLSTDDEEDIMPPMDSHKKQLTDKERAIIKQWIKEGAKYEGFWAFQIAKKPATPTVKNSSWSKQPIDLLVLKQLEKKSLKVSSAADKRTLIRRVTFDLTGLPPTLEEIKLFLADNSPQAYEKLVEGLIAKKQYGEHMAKYWLDLVRFADTNGMHKDFYRNFITYRDWVIKSFNSNLKYNDFVKYQIAGDLYAKPTNDQLIASGFNRMHLIIDRGTALPEESHVKNVIDRVTAVSTAFMGLTVQCARCHDHKYDPITQKDFYSLYAFFNNLDGAPETVGRPKNGLSQPFISFATPEQAKQLKEFDLQIAKLKKESGNLNNQIKKMKDKKKKTVLAKTKKGVDKKQKDVQNQRNRLADSVPAAMVMREKKKVNTAYILELAQYDKPGEKVERDTPAFLPPLKKKGAMASRMDLAEWLVARENPLTARVAVNRFWQQFFGVGLVKTSEDLGAQGGVPSHPKLLDYLTVSFIDSGWDIKALVKQMVLSKTYKQSSITSTSEFKKDPENRSLSRGSRFRMDSEMIRDQILSVSGLLSSKMYGRSVKPPQPDGLWRAVSMTGERFKADKGEEIYRRSLYTHWRRGMAPPQMTILNAPSREACTARRERTNTPLQALLLLNETEYMKAARHLAQKVLSMKSLSDTQKLSRVYEAVTSKVPDAEEAKLLASMIKEFEKDYTEDPKLASQMCEGISLKSQPEINKLAAWTMLVNTLFNFDITKTRE